MSGGFSPLHARMSEMLGYEAFFMSGSQVAAFVYGYPDVGLLGLQEMAENVRRITNVADIPVFADADTGYGNAVNVYYTVQAYIRAGAAGLHIEDQEAPKKSGTLAGRRLISVEEAIGKYKAAVAAKKELDPDFVVCARCDSIGAEGGGFENAIERSIAYVKEAGVDAIWVNTLPSAKRSKKLAGAFLRLSLRRTTDRNLRRHSMNFRNWVLQRSYIQASPPPPACKQRGRC